MDLFKTKTAVITGAGSGFGRELSLAFAELGWKVACADINITRAEETAQIVSNSGGQAVAIQCDVRKSEEVETLAGAVFTRWNSADIIINNAGVPVIGIMEKIPVDDWKYEIDVMLMSVIYGCRTFIPYFKKQGWGHIVNTASAAGICCLPEMGPYNATKAAVIALSETLRSELKGYNIGVTVACPTFFKTNLMDQARYTDDHQLKMADAFFNKYSFGTIESVTKKTMKAIQKNKLYVIPQPDAKIFRFLKRMTPQIHHDLTGFLYSRGIMDKLLGV